MKIANTSKSQKTLFPFNISKDSILCTMFMIKEPVHQDRQCVECVFTKEGLFSVLKQIVKDLTAFADSL